MCRRAGRRAWIRWRRCGPSSCTPRQVGKTTLVRQFAAAAGPGLCQVNLERNLYLDRVFESLDTGRILRELETLGGARLHGAILFLDEVQATPHALPALRYLYEDRPDLPVAAAGSLLEFTLSRHGFSMPVGRIQYLHLAPMTFGEFLVAADPDAGQQLASLSGGEQPPELHFWLRHARKGNAEVDYVISHGDWIVPIEVKAAAAAR